jgi:hypothetical protein
MTRSSVDAHCALCTGGEEFAAGFDAAIPK